MDIVFLALTIAAAVLLPRPRALVATVAIWAVCVAMVGWGPAHNDQVDVSSVGFWLPWGVVLVVGLVLTYAITAFRHRRAQRAT